jgi:hypothetical protein
MRIRRLAVIAVTTAALTAPAVTVTAGTAHAAGGICENGGSGLCLNDWNGSVSGPVKMGQNNFTNQNFHSYELNNMCGGGLVTHSCPFTNTSLDNALFGDVIVAILNSDNAHCIGTSQTTRGAIMTSCPNTFGNGGGWGTVMIERPNVNNCFSQNGDTQLTDRLWSDHDATIANLTGSTAVGNQAAMFNNVSFSVACWGSG